MAHHQVMILENGILRLNFPTLPKILIKVLEETLNTQVDIERVREKESSVNGFLFEAKFFTFADNSEILVTYKGFSENLQYCLSFNAVTV